MTYAQIIAGLRGFATLTASGDRTRLYGALDGLDLSALADDQLDELEGLLLAAFDLADDDDAPDVATMEETHARALAVRGEQEGRDRDDGRAQQLRDELAPDDGEAVAAAGGQRRPSAVRRAARHQQARRTPRPDGDGEQTGGSRLVWGQGNPGEGGQPQPVPDLEALGRQFATVLDTHRKGTAPIKQVVAKVLADYPEERRLTKDGDNTAKIAALIASARNANLATLTAAGGICAPGAPVYDQPFLAEDARPVRDGLVGLQADRGGIRFVPVFRYDQGPAGDGTDAFADGVTVHTVADDVAGSSKNRIDLSCGDEQTVDVHAVVRRARIGNFNARYFPELVESFLGNLAAAQAETAEVEILDAIGAAANSTAVTSAQQVGAARDVLYNLELAAVAYRDRHRMSRTAVIDVYLPSWVRSMMRTDIALSLDGTLDKLNVADQIVDGWFATRNLRVNYYWDSETGEGQNFGAQAAGALTSWPGTAVAYLHPPGTFIHLDGGELDLGLVRDSSLNDTNDLEMFQETFEAVAHLGHESIKLSMSVCVNGAVAGTVDPTTLACGS